MLAISGFAEKIKNNFIKAIELLKLKFAKKHPAAVFFAVFIFVGVGLIIPVGQAHAYWGESILEFIVNHAIYPIIYIFFFFLFYIGYVLSWLGAIILDTNLNPAIINGVLTHPAIDQGWQIFRDIANLFFILILLFIAIGTIVRSQSYNLKNLLPKLIIAVFLINFSSVIAKVIIDFGNIFMYGVLKWMCPPGSTDCFTNFYAQLMTVIDKFKDTYDITYATTAQEVVGIAVAFIYSFIYGLILLALGTFLMIRIAAFALLIVLSPLAFVGEVFPGLKEISSEWWDKLIKYVMFGPIFALLLYISGLMARITISVPTSTIFSNNPNLGIFGELYATIIVNIIPLIFLIAIIPVTQKLGIAGANAVLGATVLAGGGFLAGATKFAGGAIDRYLARGAGVKTGKGAGTLARGGAWMRRQGAYLSPGAWKRALKAHSAEGEHDYDEAAGKMRDVAVEKVADPYGAYRGRKTYHQEIAHNADIARRIKEIVTENDDEMIDMFRGATDIKDKEALTRKIGAEGSSYGLAKAMGYTKDRRGYNDLFNKELAPYMDKKSASILGADIGNLEKKKGNWGLVDLGHYDSTSHQWDYYNYNDPTNGVAQEAAHRASVVKSFKRGNLLQQTKDIKYATFMKENGDWDNLGTDLAPLLLSHEAKKHIPKIKPESLEEMWRSLDRKGAARTPEENDLFTEIDNATRLRLGGTPPGAGGGGGGGATPFDTSDIKTEGGAKKGKIYVDNSGKLVVDSAATRNLNELDEKDKDLKNEGLQEIFKHEAEHLKGKSKKAGKYSAKEMMAELQKLGKGDYKNVDDYIQKQAKAHIVADVAAHGIGAMKNIKYGTGDKDIKPSGLHFDFIRPNVQKAVIDEMERTRQGLIGKYDKRKTKSAENKETVAYARSPIDKAKQIKRDANRLQHDTDKTLSDRKMYLEGLRARLGGEKAKIRDTGPNEELDKEIKEAENAVSNLSNAIKREDIRAGQDKLFDEAIKIRDEKSSPVQKKESLKKLGDAYNKLAKEIYSSKDFQDSDIQRIDNQLRGHLEAMKIEINKDTDKVREENAGIIGKNIKDAEQKTIDSIKEKAKKAKRK